MTRRTDLCRIRNVGIMAHVDAGKTTVSERILFLTGVNHRIGEVHDGTTALDWTAQERERGITITAAATTCTWADHALTLVDTPGHVDFTVEVERSLRVLDGAVAVLDGVAGVEPQSEAVWRQADRYAVPRLVFVNKLDRPGADVHRAVGTLRERLDATPLLLQRPIGTEDAFTGVVDLLTLRAYVWGRGPVDVDERDVPTELVEDATAGRADLVEQLLDLDEKLADAYLAGAELGVPELRAAIRRVTLASRGVPVLLGSALRNKGIQPLLDAVVAYLPSPVDAGAVTGTRPDGESVVCAPDPGAAACALAFKQAWLPGGQPMTFVRVYAGTLRPGQRLTVSRTGRTERLGRVLLVHAGSVRDVDELGPGGIGAVVGLRDVRTGDTLADPAAPVRLESMEFPDPVLSVVVEPATRADADRLPLALAKLGSADPTLAVGTEERTGRTVLSGMGELHLEVTIRQLADEHGVRVATGPPSVAYRETVTRPVAGHVHRFARQTGGPGQFAQVMLDLAPYDGEFAFTDATTGGRVPREFAAATARGVRDALAAGPLGDHPVVGVQVTLVDGLTHPKDSSEAAFRTAGAAATREALALAAPVLLEPVMAVEVVVPELFLGTVIGDLAARRGTVTALGERSGARTVAARVPLADLVGYATDLRSSTQGRASFTMTPAAYERVPQR
jgi:elongation factor G